jgi:hypothetical protein
VLGLGCPAVGGRHGLRASLSAPPDPPPLPAGHPQRRGRLRR